MDARAIENLPMPATYARHLARVFDPDALFEGTGIDAALLDDGERRISVRQVLRYIENALALAEEPDWYLRWMRTIADRFHGPITLALQSAPTLGHGVDVFLEFFPSRTPYMHMQGRNEGDSFLAELWPLIDLGASKPLLVEAPLMILQQYLDTVYGVDFGEASLMLDYPPTPYADRYPRYFKPEVRFDAPSSALVIPKAWRSLPNLGYIESSWSHALQQCEATSASSREREILRQVRSCLCRGFERTARRRPLPTLKDISTELHVSPRTMIRRLRLLGTSYQEITSEFLQARAREMLANDEITIKEVAGKLGFDTPANFGRTFKRWFGISPGVYRATRLRSDASAPARPVDGKRAPVTRKRARTAGRKRRRLRRA